VESSDEVIVTYELRRPDGTGGRNTEILTFEGDKIVRTEVYFGWNLNRPLRPPVPRLRGPTLDTRPSFIGMR
jgi:hypothetical protein